MDSRWLVLMFYWGLINDEKALETFQKNHKNSKILCGDITNISYEEDIKPIIGEQKVDLIVGGPPCQGMSLSGPRKFDDPRNKLYLSYIRFGSRNAADCLCYRKCYRYC